MKNQRGSVAIWIIVILVILIIAGSAYWYSSQNSSPTTPAATELPMQQETNTESQSTNNTQPIQTTVPASSQTNTSAGQSSTEPALTATPTSGTSPATITFTGTLSGPNPSSGGGIGVYDFGIDFGDNNRSYIENVTSYGSFDAVGIVGCPTPSDLTNYVYPTSCVFSPVRHVYVYGGTYTATLWRYSQKGTKAKLGSVTIMVSGTPAPDISIPLSASPSPASPGQPVTFTTPHGGQPNTAYYVDFGDNSFVWFACGQTIPNGPVNESCLPANFQHTYSGDGTNTVTIYEYNGYFDNSPIAGTTTVTVSGTNTTSAPASVPTASSSAQNEIYTNSQYGFNIQYPNTLTPITSQVQMTIQSYFGSTFLTGFMPLVQFKVKEQSGSTPNDSIEGDLQVSIATTASLVSGCASSYPDDGDLIVNHKSTVNINGIPFSEVDGNDSATSNEFGLYSYSAVHDGACYKIEIVEQGSAYNQSDATTIANGFMPAIQSFQFTN